MAERKKAWLLLAIAATLWSLGGLLIKSIDTSPMAIAGARGAIAAMIMLLVLKKPRINWSLAQIGAALAYAATTILLVNAYAITTAANAILLQFTAPIYVVFLAAWFLKERTKMYDWLTVIIVIFGMALFFIDDLSMDRIWGNILAAASGLSFAFFTIFMRMQKDGSPMESVFLGNILTAFIGLPFIFQSVPGSNDWLLLLILGVVQLGIPYILYSKAIKHATALESILIPILEPLLNPVWVFLMLGEVPGPLALIGGAIVLVTIVLRCVTVVLAEEKL